MLTRVFFYSVCMKASRWGLVMTVSLLVSCQAVEEEEIAPGDHAMATLEATATPARQLPPDFLERAAVRAQTQVERYLELSDQITENGGADPEAIATVVTKQWLPEEIAGFAYYEQEGLRTWGTTGLSEVLVQSAHVRLDSLIEVGVIACVDSSGVFVLPLEGDDPPEIVLQWHPNYEDFEGSDNQWNVLEEFLGQPGLTWGPNEAVVFWLLGERLEQLVIDSSEQWWGVYPC